MTLPDPAPPGPTPPVLRPSVQPYSRRTVMIACTVIAVPLLAFMALGPSEKEKALPNSANGASTSVAEAPAADAPVAVEPQPDTVPAPVSPVPVARPPAPDGGNRFPLLTAKPRLAGIGFADRAENVEGALSCDADDKAKPISLWFNVGQFPNWRVESFDSYWTLNGVRVPHRLVLRIDGQSFPAGNQRLDVYEPNIFKVNGTLSFTPALQASLRQANYIELVSGNSALSIAVGSDKSAMIAIADRCAEIGASAKM